MNAQRTTGTLKVGGFVFPTIERPWIPNPNGPGGMPRQSCVPVGTYDVIPHRSEKYPNSYALVNPELGVYYQPGDIPAGQKYGRSAILIHGGTRVEHVIGCIGIPLFRMPELRSVLGRNLHKMVISYES